MSSTARTRSQRDTVFSERLYLSWWGWPLPLLGTALVAAEIHLGYPGVRAWLPYVILLPLMILLLAGMSRLKVDVTRGGQDSEPELWVGDAHLPLRFVGRVEVIDKQAKRKTLGPELDPAAFVTHRAWVPTMVRIELTDPDDPTPYWLVSTRHPERLAAVLRDQRDEPGNSEAPGLLGNADPGGAPR
ncbi:DUF3093 domain-containing protein [Prauserella oleivorans]|uniref:DUF3093 domain-containing protein n=1 Tax=Prauserella oleivorans TaxID=1478153 RepID=A0ABW5W687_9PSEU